MGDNERQGAADMIRRARGELEVHAHGAPPVVVPPDDPDDAAPPAAAVAGARARADIVAAVAAVFASFRTALSFRQAAEILEDGAGGPISRLVLLAVARRWEVPNRRDFARFAAALRRGDRAVRSIGFGLVDWRKTPEDDTAQLLGEVLPGHPTLESIMFLSCDFSLPQFRLFTSSVPATSTRLVELRFKDRPVGREQARAIADMMRRGVPLSTLEVSPRQRDGLDAVCCGLICQSASSNSNLRRLEIQVEKVLADTLDSVAAPSSSLNELRVRGSFSDEGVEGLARQLRTNTTMTQLRLCYEANEEPSTVPPDLFRPIEDVLETYNFTLQNVVVSRANPPPAAQTRIDALLLRNQRIQRALLTLQRPAAPGGRGERDRLLLLLLLPRVLKHAGSLPTLLYRFLRHGDANELCDLVQQRNGGANERRVARDEDESEE